MYIESISRAYDKSSAFTLRKDHEHVKEITY